MRGAVARVGATSASSGQRVQRVRVEDHRLVEFQREATDQARRVRMAAEAGAERDDVEGFREAEDLRARAVAQGSGGRLREGARRAAGHLRGEDRIDALGRADRHEPGAGAQRGVPGQRGGADHAARPGQDQDAPVVALVRIRPPRRQRRQPWIVFIGIASDKSDSLDASGAMVDERGDARRRRNRCQCLPRRRRRRNC